MKRPRWTTLRVRVGSRTYQVEARVVPARWPPHVSADHPRFGDPGAPGRLEIVRVMRDGIDVTTAIDADLSLELTTSCMRATGVGIGGMRASREFGQYIIDAIKECIG